LSIVLCLANQLFQNHIPLGGEYVTEISKDLHRYVYSDGICHAVGRLRPSSHACADYRARTHNSASAHKSASAH
jgi:hypothetical protein